MHTFSEVGRSDTQMMVELVTLAVTTEMTPFKGPWPLLLTPTIIITRTIAAAKPVTREGSQQRWFGTGEMDPNIATCAVATHNHVFASV